VQKARGQDRKINVLKRTRFSCGTSTNKLNPLAAGRRHPLDGGGAHPSTHHVGVNRCIYSAARGDRGISHILYIYIYALYARLVFSTVAVYGMRYTLFNYFLESISALSLSLSLSLCFCHTLPKYIYIPYCAGFSVVICIVRTIFANYTHARTCVYRVRILRIDVRAATTAAAITRAPRGTVGGEGGAVSAALD